VRCGEAEASGSGGVQECLGVVTRSDLDPRLRTVFLVHLAVENLHYTTETCHCYCNTQCRGLSHGLFLLSYSVFVFQFFFI